MTKFGEEGEAVKPRYGTKFPRHRIAVLMCAQGLVWGAVYDVRDWSLMSQLNCKYVKDIQGEEAVGNLDFQTLKEHKIWKHVLERSASIICSNGSIGYG